MKQNVNIVYTLNIKKLPNKNGELSKDYMLFVKIRKAIDMNIH